MLARKGKEMINVEQYINKIVNADCLDILKQLPDKCIDLVLTDPPYLIKNTRAGEKSEFAKSIQGMNNEIKKAGIVDGVSLDFCKEILRVQEKINAYKSSKKSTLPIIIGVFCLMLAIFSIIFPITFAPVSIVSVPSLPFISSANSLEYN